MRIHRVAITPGPYGAPPYGEASVAANVKGEVGTPAVEAWADLGDGWTAYFRLALRPGLPVAEVRMFPADAATDDDDGWNGDATAVPPQGIPVRKLRSIRLSDVRESVEAELGTAPDEHEEYIGKAAGDVLRAAFEPFARLLPERDRSHDPDLTTQQRLALVARDYVDLVAAGDPYPNRTIAQVWGRTASQVTTDIYNARHRYQLLKGAPRRGQAGGELTAKARKIIDRLDGKG